MRKNKSYDTSDLPNTQPYDRVWVGGFYHTHHNRIGGAFGWSKKEWTRHVEGLNRARRKIREARKMQATAGKR